MHAMMKNGNGNPNMCGNCTNTANFDGQMTMMKHKAQANGSGFAITGNNSAGINTNVAICNTNL